MTRRGSRRRGRLARLRERIAVLGYRAAAGVLTIVPSAVSIPAGALVTSVAYVAWPTRRREALRNFGHVLGRPPDDPAVGRLARRAYRSYARYLVELMRLPSLARDDVVGLIDAVGAEELERLWRESDGLILVAGHIGNNEACAAAMAGRGWPISVVADDSAYPELYELLERQRAAWGVRLIPWRNIRDVYAVLRRREILALLVDWGYRADGIPVRFFGAWTTLPAGPAAIAARTGATILPIIIRRQPDGRRFHATHGDPIRVTSSEPVALQQATQAIADALADAIAVAPEQWYTFKAMWPETAAERDRLAAAAAAAGERAGRPARRRTAEAEATAT